MNRNRQLLKLIDQKTKLIEEALQKNFPADLALGFLRYKILRQMSVPQFQNLFKQCLEKDLKFDDEIDKMLCNIKEKL